MSRPKRLHFTVIAKELNAYAMHVVTERRSVLCYRCAEYGHRKLECMTWKTKLCWHVPAHAPASECPFAHGDEDLRCPWRIKCVRIIQCMQRGPPQVIGCKSSEHTFRDCPLRTDAEPPFAFSPRFPPGLPTGRVRHVSGKGSDAAVGAAAVGAAVERGSCTEASVECGSCTEEDVEESKN